MAHFRLFQSLESEDFSCLTAELSDGSRVDLHASSVYHSPPDSGVLIDVEDVDALCRELRRVAKLAKQGGGNG